TVELEVAQSILNEINKKLNKGGNISELVNDVGYITDTLTQEQVEDYVFGLIMGGTNVTVNYDDVNGELTINSTDTNDIDYVSNVQLNGNLLEFTGVGNATNTSIDLSTFVDDTNNYITNVTFNTVNGVIT